MLLLGQNSLKTHCNKMSVYQQKEQLHVKALPTKNTVEQFQCWVIVNKWLTDLSRSKSLEVLWICMSRTESTGFIFLLEKSGSAGLKHGMKWNFLDWLYKLNIYSPQLQWGLLHIRFLFVPKCKHMDNLGKGIDFNVFSSLGPKYAILSILVKYWCTWSSVPSFGNYTSRHWQVKKSQ